MIIYIRPMGQDKHEDVPSGRYSPAEQHTGEPE
jgi:hypothetical protein